jgi:hypothetical protein
VWWWGPAGGEGEEREGREGTNGEGERMWDFGCQDSSTFVFSYSFFSYSLTAPLVNNNTTLSVLEYKGYSYFGSNFDH